MATLSELLTRNLNHIKTVDDLNQTSMGELCGIAQRTISNILTGSHSPSLDKLEKLAKGLRVPAWTLLHPLVVTRARNRQEIRELESIVAAYINGRDADRRRIALAAGLSDVDPKPQDVAY